MKPLNKIKIIWSPAFAYAIGLMASDGNLSIDGRHMNFTSKDENLVMLFKKCLTLTNTIGKKGSGNSSEKNYFQIQFGDVRFYNFLLDIGLTPHKSKTLGPIRVPEKYFSHFLRGSFDGDGTFYSYWDPRWKSSFMFYTVFISASHKHIEWLRSELKSFCGVEGHITKGGKTICYQLKYAKKESLIVLKEIYKNKSDIFLPRKYLKIRQALGILSKSY